MKRAIFSLLAVVVLAGLTGCITERGQRPTACMGGSCAQAPENCQSCNDPGDPGDPRCPGRACLGGRCCPCAGGGGGGADSGQPPNGAITYPYYTNRGPRDFLAKSPASIGP